MLFLPEQAGFRLPLIPDYQGMAATCYGIVLAIFVYDRERLTEFRLSWIDIPMLIWCVCSIFTSLSNGLGFYDGLNEAINESVAWGLPYFLGRIYLSNLEGLRELAVCIIKGGLLYVPLCLYEGRMSPQLHNQVYGYYPHLSGIAQAYRLGGFRPMVFMEHGLMVGMWMMTVALITFWLWRAQAISTIWQIPLKYWVILVLITFVLCRSLGTYVYFLYALLILFSTKWLRSRCLIFFLVTGIIYYLYTSTTGHFNSEGIISLIKHINPERVQSLEYRFENEILLAEHARERLILGWGEWGRNRVYEENWHGIFEDVAITDSLWILTFGINGLVGLISLFASLLLPVIGFCFGGYPLKTWFEPKVAPAAVLAVSLLLFVLDCLLNDMFNPIFPLISGGLSSLMLQKLDRTSHPTSKLPKTKNQRFKEKMRSRMLG